MADIFAADWVLSSWPFRLGSVLYDPIMSIDIASWDLENLQSHPGLCSVEPELLDPRKPYARRAQELINQASGDQHMLRALYELPEESGTLVQVYNSDMLSDQVGEWLRERGMDWPDIQLDCLEGFLASLEDMSVEEHHAFLSDWWETWETPERSGPSLFRNQAGPGGGLYGPVYGEDALQAWQDEAETLTMSDFSLWSAMRVRWGWRLEFSDRPKPTFPVLDRLDELFG